MFRKVRANTIEMNGKIKSQQKKIIIIEITKLKI